MRPRRKPMIRLFTIAAALAIAVSLVAAAPVPTHLIPNDQPLYCPVKKGTRWVYEGGAWSGTHVITAAEKNEKDGTTLVTVAHTDAGGRELGHQKYAVSTRGILWLENPSRFDTPIWLLK